MTTDLGVIPHFHHTLELSSSDGETAQADASGIKDARVDKTTGLTRSGCREPGDQPPPAAVHHCLPPQAAALSLIHRRDWN